MKEHFIPKFYLRRWCINHEIYCFSYKNKEVVHDIKSVLRTGYGHNIYSRIENGEQVNSTEKLHYSMVDNAASVTLEKILSNLSYSEKSTMWKELIPFVISLLVRHPLTIEKAMYEGQSLFEDITNNIPLEDRRTYKTEIQAITHNFQVDLVSSFTGHNDHFGLKVFDKYSSVLNNLNGQVIDFSNQKLSLLTSDFPLAAHVTQKKLKNNLIEGLIQGNIILSLPLSPSHVLYIGEELSTIRSTSKHSLLKERNLFTLHNAKFFIYASNLFQKEFIANNFNSSLNISDYPYMNEIDFCWQNSKGGLG